MGRIADALRKADKERRRLTDASAGAPAGAGGGASGGDGNAEAPRFVVTSSPATAQDRIAKSAQDALKAASAEQMMMPLRVIELSAAIKEQVKLKEATGKHTRPLDQLAIDLIRSSIDAVESENLPIACVDTLAAITDEALVACMAHLSATAAQKTYRYLRSSICKPKCRHGKMFDLLPTMRRRLQLLNCLHRIGGGDPGYYSIRFGKHFPGRRLAYSREHGFSGAPKPQA